MGEGIVDSSVLIDCLRGRAEAVTFLRGLGPHHRPRTHLVVTAELLTGARDKREVAAIDSFLRLFDLVVPGEAEGVAALDLYRRYRLSHGVDWPDCQIAASAVALGVPVVTRNVKHFAAFPSLRVVSPY